jgi:hypothetical protein
MSLIKENYEEVARFIQMLNEITKRHIHVTYWIIKIQYIKFLIIYNIMLISFFAILYYQIELSSLIILFLTLFIFINIIIFIFSYYQFKKSSPLLLFMEKIEDYYPDINSIILEHLLRIEFRSNNPEKIYKSVEIILEQDLKHKLIFIDFGF